MNDAKKWFRRRLGLGEERNLAASEAVQGIELEGERSVADRDLSSSFTEHHLDRHELTELFLLSNINASQPTASQGLSAEEAQRCLERDGRNALTPPVEISDWQLLLRQFLNMFWLLLIAAGILSLITYFLDTTVPLNLYVAIILFVMVIVMCLISFYEEKKAKEVVHGFQSLMPTSCSVIRDGRKRVISAEELVVGDLVFIRNGCRVAADVRLLHCSGVKLETSSITGEAEPIEFTSDPAAEEVSVFESHNVAFNGSFCVDGEGLGVVIRVADKTIIGQIASLTTSQEEKKSSLEKQVEKFVRFITILALVMATIVFFIGAAVSNFRNLLSTFINGFLVVIVANVPQGLPATLTSQLTIIARRMAKKNVFLKKLDVIEAFGAATVIASDKTGTLTKNIMTVTDLWYNKQYMTGRPDIKQRTIMAKQHVTNVLELYESPLPEMLAVMTVCNKAQIDMTVTRVPMRQSVRGNMAQILWSPSAKDQDPERGAIRRQSTRKSGRYFQGQMSQETAKRKNISGNPSEVALLRYASQMTDVHDMRRCFDVVFEIPFNSVRKWHLLIARRTDKFAKDGMATFTLMMKGAPEKLIDLCTTIASESGEVELTEDEKMDFQDAYLHFGNEGRRVIGFASKTFVAAEDTNFSQEAGNYPQGKYSFLGMAAIMDPPRDDTAKAIQECRLAGIKVFMVTGDHPTTAAAIARQIGLIGQSETVERQGREKIQMSVVEQHDSDYAIVHGDTLPSLTSDQWDDLLQKKNIVFARTTPEHKLLIVEECQRRGEIVAVTGDGVNDAPALKRADIGVAMGIVGSDVAKQAADIILMDDNFASIVKGIEEGRLLYDNLKKTIAYTITHLVPEIVPVILNFALGFPVGLTSLQILSIDLGSEMAPAISLANEKSERDIMTKPPRKRDAQLVGWSLLAYSYLFAGGIMTVGCFFAYLSVYWYYGISVRDMAFSSTDHWMLDGGNNFTSNGLVFSPNEQRIIMAQGTAAWHITMVMSQVFHLWMCTTRRVSIFRHGISNTMAIVACIIATVLINLFVYVPGVQYIMGTDAPPSHVWYFCAIVGVVLCVFSEWRKFMIRRYPYNNFVRIFKW